jgi:glycosyltransferase involved in cell wall biosynthesis
MPLVSVITPTSRGVKHLAHLIRDFRNQTFQDFEHLIVRDGPVPEDVQQFMTAHAKDYNIRFCSIPKDPGNMDVSPGTNPRNHGIKIAKGKFCCFFDDDDRAKDSYLERLIFPIQSENMMSVVQMSCQESRIYRDGKPDRIILVPEVGMPFPTICHVGTPCFMVPLKWAQEDPWQHEPEHDFRFLKRMILKHKPLVSINYGMQVDVDGLVIKGMKDFVSKPPFYRG